MEGGSVQTGPFGSQLHESDYTEFGIPVIMPKDIVDDQLDLTNIAHISIDDAKRLSQHIVQKNDIVCPRRGEIGKRIIINNETVGAFCGTGCIRLRGTSSILNPLFLFYFLKQPRVVKWIENQAIGATMMNLNTSILNSIPITYPSLSVQNKIVSLLLAYDNLIENNKQRITLLEELAEEIYKEWFVRLRFPGFELARFLGVDGIEVQAGTADALPVGWKKNKIADIFVTSSGGTPFRAKDEYYVNGNINWIKTKELLDSFIFESEEKISEFGLKNSSAKIFPKDTVLIGMYGGVHGEGRKSTLGQLGILAEPSSTNQACCAFIPKNEHFYSYPYLFLFLKTKRLDYLNMSMGAAQQNISQDIILNSIYINPSNDIIKQFDSIVKPFFEEIKNLSQKNTLLQQTRDLLLPRLISGKLSVEHLVEQNPEGVKGF
jgi:type I restriction enzyme S subunit